MIKFIIKNIIHLAIWIGLYFILKDLDISNVAKYCITFLVAEVYTTISTFNMINEKEKKYARFGIR